MLQLLQNAPIGAFCNTFDLHLAIIGLEKKHYFFIFLKVAVLDRFYCRTECLFLVLYRLVRRVGCFASSLVFFLSCYCYCSISLPRGAAYWSVMWYLLVTYFSVKRQQRILKETRSATLNILRKIFISKNGVCRSRIKLCFHNKYVHYS